MTASLTALPFDDIRALFARLPEADADAAGEARDRDIALGKRPGSLGRLEELAEWLAAWQGRAPATTRPVVALFAGEHGVAARLPQPAGSLTTRQEVEFLTAGGGAVNQICAAHDLGLKVLELALDYPTPDIAEADAFDEAGCAATMAFGMEAVAGGMDLLALGSFGTGGEAVAAAVALQLFGGAATDWTADGPVATAATAAAGRLGEGLRDPLEVLRRVGGREAAAIAGAILAARFERVPVLLDGEGALAAAAVLKVAAPHALDHCRLASAGGAGALAEALSLKPLLDLGIAGDQGAGAALGMLLVKTAATVHTGMATRETAGLPPLGASLL
jgi:nicotinate-nucleotide--dimethylbenzimidazole phosphoribosyltransferase